MATVDWVVVPSIWWENAPLVIQEAFHHKRPVICSGIGGMAESVRDGVDGLWFRAGDAVHLSQQMEAALDPALWSRFVESIEPPRMMPAAARDHLDLYWRVMSDAQRRAAEAEPIAALAG